MSDWISTKDRLPEEGQEVLVSTKSKNGQRNVDKGYYLPEESRFVQQRLPTGCRCLSHREDERTSMKPYIVYFFIKENRKKYLADVVIEAASAKEACARCKEWYFKKTGKNAFRPTTSISDETKKWHAEHDSLAILNINE